MPQLSQLLAIYDGRKTRAREAITKGYHQVKRPNLFAGISRTYRPLEDGGETFPSELSPVQLRADEVVEEAISFLAPLFDAVIAMDTTNGVARANVEVDGVTLLENVPATTLLFLDKQLVDLRTFVAALPVLDPSEEWIKSEIRNLYETPPVETNRTKKIPKSEIIVPPTDKHPAQVTTWQEDVTVGFWKTVKSSGAKPAHEVTEIIKRIDSLREAVKYAKEKANSVEVQDAKMGQAVMAYLFRG